MSSKFLPVSTVLILALLGAGCSKKPTTPVIPNNPQPSAPAPVVVEPHQAIRDAVKKFQNTKSFRANVSVSTSADTLKAKLEFMKPSRFRGTVDLGKNGQAEMIVVNNDLFMRVNDQNWKALTASNGSKTIGETLRNALNGDANLDSLGTDDKSEITTSYNSTQDCDEYRTKLKTADGNVSDVTICIADGLPKVLDITTPQGPVHLEYYDYNTVFLIEKPI